MAEIARKWLLRKELGSCHHARAASPHADAVAGRSLICACREVRFTEGADFVAATGHREVLERNPEVMRAFHFDPSCTWKLYHESGTDVDIWKDELAEEIVQRACTVKMAGREVRVVEVHDLVAMKLRAGRIQDDFDIAEIILHMHLQENLIEQQVIAGQMASFRRIAERVEKEKGNGTADPRAT